MTTADIFKTKKKDSVVRQHNIFFKIKLPQTMSERVHEQTKEVIKNIQDIMSKLWEIDSSLVVRAWAVELSDSQVLKQKHSFPNKRETISQYFPGIYYYANRIPYIRVLLGFNKETECFTTGLSQEFKKWLTRASFGFHKEKLQDRNICRVGWLLGSHPSVFNYDDMEDAIHSLEDCKSIRVELKAEEVKITKVQQNWNAGEFRQTPVRAVHIWCTFAQTSLVRSKMKALFSSKTKKKPLGKSLRFIPHILDNRFITTEKTAMLTARMKSKQKKFLQQTTFTTAHGILGLDYVIPSLHISLRQALMAIRSKENPEKNIFISVDGWGDQVRFAFNMAIADEADRLIPALPIFLEATLGPAVWTWFSAQAQQDCEDFEWDPDQGIVDKHVVDSQGQIEDNDSIESEEDSDIENDLDIEFGESTANIFTLNLDNFGLNQYDDGGSVATGALFPKGRNRETRRHESTQDTTQNGRDGISQPTTVITGSTTSTENSPFSSITPSSVDTKAHNEMAKQMAQIAMDSIKKMRPAELEKMLNSPSAEKVGNDPHVAVLQGAFKEVILQEQSQEQPEMKERSIDDGFLDESMETEEENINKTILKPAGPDGTSGEA